MIRTKLLISHAALLSLFSLAAIAKEPAPIPDKESPKMPGSPEELIRRHRMGIITVAAPPGTAVRVEQLRHEFWFGTAISRGPMCGKGVSPRDRAKYLEVLKDNFNATVHENAMKWYSTEREKDELAYGDADAMLEWCERNEIPLRGHCVFWCVDKFVQPWIKGLTDEELRRRLEGRAKLLLKRYRGRVPEYDVNNEMLHANYYAERLGEEIRVQMFKWCKEADPEARLYVNDYGIISGGGVGKYERHIKQLLEAGAPIGGIGVQGHFGLRQGDEKEGGISPNHLKSVLDRLAKFGLPIKVTEFDLLTDNEEAKKIGLTNLYRTCFAHPAVDGILMWGFWEGCHWRPKAAPWKRDWTPTPGAEAYRDLVYNQWWTRWVGKTGADGRVQVPAFYGRHRVQVGDRTREIDLPKVEGTATVDFQ